MFHAPDTRKIRPKARPVPRIPRKGHIYRRAVRGLFQPKIRRRPRENPVLRTAWRKTTKSSRAPTCAPTCSRRAHVERALRSRREQARRRQVFKGFRKKDFRLVRWARNGSDRAPYGRILFVARASAKRASPESLARVLPARNRRHFHARRFKGRRMADLRHGNVRNRKARQQGRRRRAVCDRPDGHAL